MLHAFHRRLLLADKNLIGEKRSILKARQFREEKKRKRYPTEEGVGEEGN